MAFPTTAGFIQSLNLSQEFEYHIRSMMKEVGTKGKEWQIVRGGSILNISGGTGHIPVQPNGMPDWADPVFQVGDLAGFKIYDANSLDDFEDGDYTVYHTGGNAKIATAADIGSGAAGSAYTYRDATKTVSPVASATGSSVFLILEDQTATDVRVWGPGFDPALDADSANPVNREVAAKLATMISPGGFARFSDLTGVLIFGEGYWQHDTQTCVRTGTLTYKGWLPSDLATWQASAGNHKRLDDIRQSQEDTGGHSGMSLKYICDISDAIGRDPWWTFCPAYTDQQFDRCLSYLWSRYQGTGRKVRVEYGLEPWNPDLPTWNMIEYLRCGTGKSNIRYLAEQISRFIARIDIIDPTRQVFDFYLGGHSRNPTFLSNVYNWLTKIPDSIGVAYYFGPSPSQIAQWNSDPPNSYPQTPEEIIQAGDDARITLRPLVNENINAAANYAASKGVPTRPFVIYEGGWSFYTPQVLQSLMNQANVSAEMGVLYDDVVADIQSLAIDEVCWYKAPDPSEGASGSWGHGRTYFGSEWNDIRAQKLRGYVGDISSAVDGGESGLTASPRTRIIANGVDKSTVIVTARDSDGDPVPDQEVTITVSGQENIVVQPPTTTNAQGEATATVASTDAGTKVVSATINPSGSPVVVSEKTTVGFVWDRSRGTPKFTAHKVTRL